MKKTLGLMVMTAMLSVNAFAYEDPEPLIECKTSGNDHAYIRVDEGVDGAARASYNYSSARLVCPWNFDRRLEQRRPIKCFGLWEFDFDEEGQKDTIAEVIFSPLGDQGWEAQFTTSHAYGRIPVTVPCEK